MTEMHGLTSGGFVGFENFQRAFAHADFWNAFGITFRFVFFSVVITNVVALAVALLVTSGLKGQNFFRVGFFTPNLIGGIILGHIWQFVFIRMLPVIGETFNIGFLSRSWLSDPTLAFWALVLVTVWQSSGYMMLIYIAGLMGVSDSLIEAAALDGANFIQKLVFIKLPLMIPAFTICLFLTLRGSFMIYDLNLALTDGGPFRTTEMISMTIFREAFVERNFGVAQSMAIILFIIIAIFSVAQVATMKRMEVE
jgi:raffinose/stachyose/melibiose transport system permease protein